MPRQHLLATPQHTSHHITAFSPSLPHLLNEVDGGLEVKAEINELPLDALALVFLLLQDEHGVVEQLLQLLVGVVDAQLFKAVGGREEMQR